tara:strand:- start:158 stop:277 length:120 start_codon:yes stop_codon:yes gene_type:complete
MLMGLWIDLSFIDLSQEKIRKIHKDIRGYFKEYLIKIIL